MLNIVLEYDQYIVGLVGLSKFCPALGHHNFLRELLLSSNSFGDEGAEILFSNLLKGEGCILERLSLDNCQLVTCQWARHLPELDRLHTLSFSNNRITDVGLAEICQYGEKCFNIRHLNIAMNCFGEKAMSIGSLIQFNPGILNLNVSGNRMEMESVEAIAFGLVQNSTMRRLDMTSCALYPESALKLCKSLLVNEVTDLVLAQNPIDEGIQQNSREYVFHNQHLFGSDHFTSGMKIFVCDFLIPKRNFIFPRCPRRLRTH